MGRTTSIPPAAPGPCTVALLRGGDRAATVAVLALHLRGAVGGPAGHVRKTGTGGCRAFGIRWRRPSAPVCTGPPARASCPAARSYGGPWPGCGPNSPRTDCGRAAPPHPGRPPALAGARTPPAARRPRRPAGGRALLAAALYGERALTVLVPRFAREPGSPAGARARGRGPLPVRPGREPAPHRR
ncbi:hypothetical protein LT493_32090 [Streptomyces tricolor]|nr:hypothetical protein [Streptomyces tricolor]